IQFQLPGYVDALREIRSRARAFERPPNYPRGMIVRCRVAGHQRSGVIVSNDQANGLASCRTVQALLLGRPVRGWSSSLETVSRSHALPILKVLLKAPGEGADCVTEPVGQIS